MRPGQDRLAERGRLHHVLPPARGDQAPPDEDAVRQRVAGDQVADRVDHDHLLGRGAGAAGVQVRLEGDGQAPAPDGGGGLGGALDVARRHDQAQRAAGELQVAIGAGQDRLLAAVRAAGHDHGGLGIEPEEPAQPLRLGRLRLRDGHVALEHAAVDHLVGVQPGPDEPASVLLAAGAAEAHRRVEAAPEAGQPAHPLAGAPPDPPVDDHHGHLQAPAGVQEVRPELQLDQHHHVRADAAERRPRAEGEVERHVEGRRPGVELAQTRRAGVGVGAEDDLPLRPAAAQLADERAGDRRLADAGAVHPEAPSLARAERVEAEPLPYAGPVALRLGQLVEPVGQRQGGGEQVEAVQDQRHVWSRSVLGGTSRSPLSLPARRRRLQDSRGGRACRKPWITRRFHLDRPGGQP